MEGLDEEGLGFDSVGDAQHEDESEGDGGGECD